MESKSLKPESYYSDLYDRGTVEQCRWHEREGEKKEKSSKKGKEAKLEEIKSDFSKKVITPIVIYAIKGERYIKKEETIREWMDKDSKKDELFESAQPLEGIRCLTCKSPMTVILKDLHSQGLNEESRVLFMYSCPNGCLPNRAFFNDGEEWRPSPHLCLKCNSGTKEEHKRKGNVITTIYTCLKCKYKEVEKLDLGAKPKSEKPDPNFAKDRDRFCLSKEEGEEYRNAKIQLEQLGKIIEKYKEREKHEEIYDKVDKINKLNIAGLKNLLTPILEKEQYIGLEFAQPEISRNIIVSFTVQDNKADRGEYDSKHQLQKLVQSTLVNTNWRLMSEGIGYRLGILSGRLRGYELEKDLVILVK